MKKVISEAESGLLPWRTRPHDIRTLPIPDCTLSSLKSVAVLFPARSCAT